MRKGYELTDEQYEKLLEACKPVRYMIIGGLVPRSPQENANQAWCELGRELGFDGMSVEPIHGSPRSFTAEAREVEGK